MILRSAVLVASLALAALGVPAGASTTYACPLVTDARGDDGVYARTLPTGDTDSDPREDLLSADLWADSARITGVVRLAQLPAPTEGDDLTEKQGHLWQVQATRYVGDTPYVVVLELAERSGHFSVAVEYQQGNVVLDEVAGSTFSVDATRGTLRVSAPLASFPAFLGLRPGVRLTEVTAYSFRLTTVVYDQHVFANPGGVADGRDVATTDRAVVIGRPRCAR